MSATEVISVDSGLGRNSLPDFQSSEEASSPGSFARSRRSFRRSGRSSDSTSSEKAPFLSSFSRSSLRSASCRGSPSPARKLTTPQGPNLATASRNRQCKCSEVHHHGPHGHITPVVPRVPLERERATRRSRGAAVADDDKNKTASTRLPDAGSKKPSREERKCSRDGRDTSRDGKDTDGRDASQDGRKSSLSKGISLNARKISGNDNNRDGLEKNLQSIVPASEEKLANRKGSVTTMVKWVPWLAEKRYSTTLTISPSAPPTVTSTVKQVESNKGLHCYYPQQPKMKVIQTSSSSAIQPSFLTSIGAPPAIIARLSMA
ncbi:uncharacterized protein LOC108669545 [Hyalella azteca]|uniref:Uncharacterized protein LOC108669545 n=1 Tax=Hyalella azteca TaxID=294128 RepID=A0A8B7NFL0_HYAAZ|nr:uncharacterized protein LOC108669545 [Hyalella azteca]